MGLIAETEAASTASQELNSTSIADTTMVDEFSQAVTVRHHALVAEIQSTNQRLQALETFLHTMDSALASGLVTFQTAATGMQTRVQQLHSGLQQDLDANDQAIQALVPQVQMALQEVEKAVSQTERDIQELAAVQRLLVSEAEAAAGQAGEHAAQMLTAVTSELQQLTALSTELDVNWGALSSQIDLQVAALREEFGQAATAAQKALVEVISGLTTQSSEVDQKVRQAFLVETLEHFEQLSRTLEEALGQLKDLAKQPLELGETMQGVTQKLTETVSEPLALIRAIHNKADQTYNLFSFQYK